MFQKHCGIEDTRLSDTMLRLEQKWKGAKKIRAQHQQRGDWWVGKI